MTTNQIAFTLLSAALFLPGCQGAPPADPPLSSSTAIGGDPCIVLPTGVLYCGCYDPITMMPLPPDDCDSMPEAYSYCPQTGSGNVLNNWFKVPYRGTDPHIAFFSCDGLDCDPNVPSPVLTVFNSQFVVEFINATTLRVYPVPGPGSYVSPTGRMLYPLLPAGDPFAAPSKPVNFVYMGTPYNLFIDIQNDCFRDTVNSPICLCNPC